jgi:hypothetical protein
MSKASTSLEPKAFCRIFLNTISRHGQFVSGTVFLKTSLIGKNLHFGKTSKENRPSKTTFIWNVLEQEKVLV